MHLVHTRTLYLYSWWVRWCFGSLFTCAQVRNEKARRFLASMRKKPGVDLAAYFPRADAGALALLRRLLAFDPSDRPSAEEALADPYFHNLHSPAREPSAQVRAKGAYRVDLPVHC